MPHTGEERANVLKEVDDVAMYHYKLKLAHEDKLRRRFGRAQDEMKGADAEDEAVSKLMDNVMGDLDVGDLVRGEAEDAAADAADDSEEYSSSEYETASDSEDNGSGSGSDESSSEETNEGASSRPRPGIATRSSTIAHLSDGSQRFPTRSNHQREREQERTPRGRAATSDNAHTLRSRSQTRSIQAIKNMLKKSSPQSAPPVPPVPLMIRQSSSVNPYDKPLPPSPMVSRTSVESNRSQKQPRPALPQLHPRKGKDKVGGLKTPRIACHPESSSHLRGNRKWIALYTDLLPNHSFICDRCALYFDRRPSIDPANSHPTHTNFMFMIVVQYLHLH